MKKIWIGVAACLLAGAGFQMAEARDCEGVYAGEQVVYFPSSKFFASGGMAEGRIVLSKKTSSGSGSYSEYYYPDGKLAMVLGSNFEFLKDGKLIASHNADLTFYNVVYKKGVFKEKKLCAHKIQRLFPNVKIIKISKFKKGRYTLTLPPDGQLRVLLLNNTKANFYRYGFTPSDVKTTDIAGLIEITKPGKIEFSHFGEDSKIYPKYTLIVK